MNRDSTEQPRCRTGRVDDIARRHHTRLSRRPGHGAPAEQVDVEMVDGLAAIRASIDDDAVALAEALLLCYARGHTQQVAEQAGLRVVGLRE
jgi:hypothetical protein